MKTHNLPQRTLTSLTALVFMFTLLLSLNGLKAGAQCSVTSIAVNTGIDPITGTPIVAGVGNQDPLWTVVAVSSSLVPIVAPNTTPYQAYAVTKNSTWVASAVSDWISVIPANTFPTSATGTYVAMFTRSFRTCVQDKIDFNLNIANDNYCSALRVDGMLVPIGSPFSQPAGTTPGNYTAFTSIPTFSLNLPAGLHTIDVEIVDYPVTVSTNPFGLNIVGTVSSATSTSSLVSNACPNFTCCDPQFTYCINSASPYTTVFNANTPSQPGMFSWTVNGSPAGSGPSLPYTFPGPGSYKVCLHVDNSQTGQKCDQCLNICIPDNGHPPAKPQAEMNGSGTTGMSADKQMNILKVYPNPTDNQLNIELMNGKAGDVNINVYDVMGKKLIRQTQRLNIGEQKITLSMAQLAKGVYSLEISNGSSTVIQKLVKE